MALCKLLSNLQTIFGGYLWPPFIIKGGKKQMKKTNIIFEWKRHGVTTQKEVGRQALYDIFDGIAKGFEGDNEMSLKLLKFIPTIDKIYIDEDININQDVPGIVLIEGDNKELLKIIRYHKIVWSIFEKFESE